MMKRTGDTYDTYTSLFGDINAHMSFSVSPTPAAQQASMPESLRAQETHRNPLRAIPSINLPKSKQEKKSNTHQKPDTAPDQCPREQIKTPLHESAAEVAKERCQDVLETRPRSGNPSASLLLHWTDASEYPLPIATSESRRESQSRAYIANLSFQSRKDNATIDSMFQIKDNMRETCLARLATRDQHR